MLGTQHFDYYDTLMYYVILFLCKTKLSKILLYITLMTSFCTYLESIF